jgi:hypothetical protein
VLVGEVLGEREADALGHAALDLAPHLRRVDVHARVGGVHAVQDPDLTGDGVHRHPEPVAVERHAAGRPEGLARLGQAHATLRRGRSHLDEGQAVVPHAHAPVVERARVDRGAGVERDELEDAVVQRGGGAQHGVAGHEQPGARERAGVEPGAVGVGLHDAHLRRRGAQLAGGQLDVGGGGAFAELDRTDGELVDAVGAEGHPRLGGVVGGWGGLVQRAGGAGAHGPVGPEGLVRVVGVEAGERLVDPVDALQQTVLVEHHVVGAVVEGDERVAGAHDVAASKLERVEAEQQGELVHRRLHGERRLGHAVAADGSAGHRVGVHRVRVDLLVGAPVDGDGGAGRREQGLAAVIAVGPGVGHGAHREPGEGAVAGRRASP